MNVVAASIENNQGQVLISKRPAHTYGGGLWELPGGKLEANESPEDALFRELDEELGIQVSSAKPLIKINHQYPDRSVHLMIYQVTHFEGNPHGKEGQEVRWVSKADIAGYTFPGANKPAIDAIRLPDVIAIGLDAQTQSSDQLLALKQLLSNGVGACLLSADAMNGEANSQQDMLNLFKEYSAFCFLQTSPDNFNHADIHGLHLSKEALLKTEHRPSSVGCWLSAHCETLADVVHAEKIGVDFVLFGSVAFEASEPFDWLTFEQVTAHTKLPVYAISDADSSQVELSRAKGGRGVAAMIHTLLGD